MMLEGDLYRGCMEVWGEDFQLDMVIEECAELIQALTKLKRKHNGSTWEQVASECVDVDVMVSQLKGMLKGHGYPEETLEDIKRAKLERLEAILTKEGWTP